MVRTVGLFSALACGLGLDYKAKAAEAAEVGGDNYLDEAVAKLGATAADKANRKVSVTVSGYVTKQVMAWNDGAESNVYVADIGPTQATNLRFLGSAKISADWSAGFLLRIQDLNNNPMGLNQFNDNADLGLSVQMSYWYLQSAKLGKASLGKNALASKSAAMFTDLSGTQLIANYVLFDGNAFFLRQRETLLRLRWGDFAYCYSQQRPWGGDCDGIVMDGVRYDSPTFGGFSVSASFGMDDDFEAAARYQDDIGGFKIALGVGYSRNIDQQIQPPPISFAKNSDYFQAGGYAQHLASGLFLHAAYGSEDNNRETIFSGLAEPDTHHWYLKGGIRRQWNAIGHTILYGEYAKYTDQLSPAALNDGATGSELFRWGFGAAQEIDAAAMTIWVKYRQQGVSITGPGLNDVDDFRYVTAGGLISF
ncbi:porin [Methyloceanibacter sp.]|uniref:porin n=1 Tax=Methyloceanibacter sp. TaxID=1965321 RepID=UPI003D6CBFF8